MVNNGKKVPSAEELRAMLEKEASDLGIKGRLTGAMRMASIFDEGTFVEIGKYAKAAASEFSNTANEFEGVVTGYGAIDGRLVFAFAQDFSRMKGAVGEMHAKKIAALYELAIKNSAPVIGVFDSAGAYVLEGVAALSGYGKIMNCVSKANGIIPQIAVIAGICSGSMATIASMFDFTIACENNGEFYINPPFIMNKKKNGKELGSIKSASDCGLVDFAVAGETEAYAKVRELLNFLPQNCADGTVYSMTGDEINRLTPEVSDIISAAGYDMKSVIASISDNGAFCERAAMYAPEMLTGFITLNSMVVGVVANAPAVNGGRITANAAKKAAKHIAFCDNFDVPVLTLVDTEGYDVSVESEKAPYSDALAELAYGFSVSDNSKVSVVLGNAYGAAYTLMCSKSLGADIAYAVDNAKISVMPTDSAVAFVKGGKVTDEERAEWEATMASPVLAARNGDIDDIISCDELRQRVAAAFEMLSDKGC